MQLNETGHESCSFLCGFFLIQEFVVVIECPFAACSVVPPIDAPRQVGYWCSVVRKVDDTDQCGVEVPVTLVGDQALKASFQDPRAVLSLGMLGHVGGESFFSLGLAPDVGQDAGYGRDGWTVMPVGYCEPMTEAMKLGREKDLVKLFATS